MKRYLGLREASAASEGATLFGIDLSEHGFTRVRAL
jgi:hypothetical protein